MWIESIDLDDFGHFDRARVRDLDAGLTVVAGPQRAGKTTFMEAVRYLGYGLTTGSPVPPPSDRYDVAATVVQDDSRYELALEGYATPTVTALDDDAPARTPRELFGGMRKTQYQQLYTVSLEELSLDPDSLGDDVDLSGVLLEAAAGGNITDVPDLRDEFATSAKSIGGKRGRASYDLKDPIETIQAGIDARDSATEQVSEYEETEAEKHGVEARIVEIEDDIDALETEETRLEAVSSGHEPYEEYQEYAERLETMAVEDVDQFPVDRLDGAISLQADLESNREALAAAEREFDAAVDVAEPQGYRQRLLDSRSAIERYERERSGWNERVGALEETDETLTETRRELEARAEKLGPNWDGDPLEAVGRLDTDLFTQTAIEQSVEAHQSAESDVEDLSQTIDELAARKEELEDRIEQAVDRDEASSAMDVAPVVVVGAILAFVGGAGLAVTVDPLVGVAVTTLVLLGTGAYAFSRLDADTLRHDGVAIDTLRAEAEKVQTELDTKQSQLAQRRAELSAAESTLDDVREAYDLPETTSAPAIGRFHEELVDLEAAVAEYRAENRQYEENRTDLREDLDEVVETLAAVGVIERSIDDSVVEASAVLSAIDRAGEDLERAASVEMADQRLEDTRAAVVGVLEQWEETAATTLEDEPLARDVASFVEHGERVREYQELRDERALSRERLLNHLGVATYSDALAPVVEDAEREADDDWLEAAYEAVMDEHGSIEAVEQRREAEADRIEDLEAEKERCRESLAALDRQLEDLASDEDVRAAHETIEQGRRRLEPLAEDYAANRIAASLLDELYERFIERTTGPLLEEASEIFQRITGEEYTSISTREAFEDLDFEAELEDGGRHRTNELSRATAEQLFLAVRLARIKRYEEPLPVLLDDSLTNFDPAHARRTLDVICELADEVQIFLLTCHPTLVDRVADSYEAQYWRLDEGDFEGPHRSKDPVLSVFDDGASASTPPSQR